MSEHTKSNKSACLQHTKDKKKKTVELTVRIQNQNIHNYSIPTKVR